MPITDDELAARGAMIVRSVSAAVEPPLAFRERIEVERARPRRRGRFTRWRRRLRRRR